MATSLLLDLVNWDLCVDANGNIALCTEPYADVQDAACAIRLFAGELYYDTTQGCPFWSSILGQMPSAALFNATIEAAALSATNVVTATCSISSWAKRGVVGNVQVTNVQGQTISTAWAVPLGVGSI